MKQAIKYFSIAAAVIFVSCLIISIFYSRSLYQALIVNNESNWPPFITAIINRLPHREAPAPKIIFKSENTIKILEGWTSLDINRYFDRSGQWPKNEFLAVAGWPRVDYRHTSKPALTDFSDQFSFLADKPKYYGLEGYLFPDTYRIYASSTATEVVEKMLTNFDEKLTPQLRADIKAQGKTIYDIVTMASIIEKEAPINYQTGDNHDARIISGIFWKRLKVGQALQSDATLSYILDDTQPQHSNQDLQIDSPYNTYKYRGLPPGPICNPGILAIEAAIYPIATDYYYFLTPPSGNEVIYARTNDEQNINKNKYLR